MSDAEGFERVEVSFDNVRISILRKKDHTGFLVREVFRKIFHRLFCRLVASNGDDYLD